MPYAAEPVLLNCYLTLKCNMNCVHCVARDMASFAEQDMDVSERKLARINASPFLVVVVTGGEPFLPESETRLLALLAGLVRQGLVVDTNGTIVPSGEVIKALLHKKVLVRVSLDSPRLQDEASLRACVKRPRGQVPSLDYSAQLRVMSK